jgi:hypothetical protein
MDTPAVREARNGPESRGELPAIRVELERLLAIYGVKERF